MVAAAIFATLMFFTYGGEYYYYISYGGSYYGFPSAWFTIISRGGMTTSIFSAILITLLVASEFDWRTSRQNIIDGVAKYQWFTAKVLLIPTVSLCFYCFQLATGGILNWIGTAPEVRQTIKITNVQVLAFSGGMLGMFLFSCLALLFSMITRSAGPALGITFAYFFLEQLANRTLRGLGLDDFADCLPGQVMSTLFNYTQYDPDSRFKPSSIWETDLLISAGLAWVIIFTLLAWLVYGKRDL